MLYLTSQASKTMSKLIPFLKDKPENLRVAFIPTAADPYASKPWMEEDRDRLSELGFKVFEVDIKDRTEKELRGELKDIDIIFVAGGNTFYLLEKARKSGFEELVKELVGNGVLYIGSSAGSVIAGPNIEAVQDFDDPKEAELNSTIGFGLVDFVVLPHFKNPKYAPLQEAVIKKFGEKYKIVPITDY